MCAKSSRRRMQVISPHSMEALVVAGSQLDSVRLEIMQPYSCLDLRVRSFVSHAQPRVPDLHSVVGPVIALRIASSYSLNEADRKQPSAMLPESASVPQRQPANSLPLYPHRRRSRQSARLSTTGVQIWAEAGWCRPRIPPMATFPAPCKCVQAIAEPQPAPNCHRGFAGSKRHFRCGRLARRLAENRPR